jgi:hypothetical protein
LRPLTDASGREPAQHARHLNSSHEITKMFLTAVLQAHTDSLAETSHDEADTTADSLDDTSVRLPRLDEALGIPVQDRVQTLPNAHRSRWV